MIDHYLPPSRRDLSKKKFENFKAELIFERCVLRPILDLAISVDLKGQLEFRPLYPSLLLLILMSKLSFSLNTPSCFVSISLAKLSFCQIYRLKCASALKFLNLITQLPNTRHSRHSKAVVLNLFCSLDR